jgi:hypothetical protein
MSSKFDLVKQVGLLFLLILPLSSCFSQNCHLPGDGIYKVQYENVPADTPKYKLRIAGEKFFSQKKEEKKKMKFKS